MNSMLMLSVPASTRYPKPGLPGDPYLVPLPVPRRFWWIPGRKMMCLIQLVLLVLSQGFVHAVAEASKLLSPSEPGPVSAALASESPAHESDCSYYMSPSGDDTHPGTAAAPWGTFPHALGRLQPGDTLCLMDGTYAQPLDIRAAGTEAAPITVRAQHDGRAVIDGEYVHAACQVKGTHDVLLEGVICRRSAGDVLLVVDSQRVVIRRVSAYDVRQHDCNCQAFGTNHAEDVLFEDVIAGGRARTSFTLYTSRRITVRRAFALWQEEPTSDSMGVNNLMQVYGTDDSLVENCAGTLAGSTENEVQGWGLWNHYYNTDPIASRNTFIGNIAYGLTHSGFFDTTCRWQTQNNVFRDNASIHNRFGMWQRGDDTQVLSHFTHTGGEMGFFMRETSPDGECEPVPGFSLGSTLTESVFEGVRGDVFNILQTDIPKALVHTHNLYWDNDAIGLDLHNSETGSADPIFDTDHWGYGAYLFPDQASPRINGGEDGDYLGADIRFRSEDAVLTTEPLWPWPMEERICDELGVSVTWELSEQVSALTGERCGGGLWKTLDGVYSPAQEPVVYYVARDGRDDNPGGIDSPWRTIQHAVDTVQPGDTVYVRAGVYSERVFLPGTTGVEGQSGSETQGMITYAAYPGEQVVLDGSGFSSGSAFLSGKAAGRGTERNPAVSYLRLSGFEIRGYPEYGIAFENDSRLPEGSRASHHIVIENCSVHDNGNVGILFEGGDRAVGGSGYELTIHNCDVYANANHGIKLTGDEPGVLERERIHNALIENNRVYENAQIGIHISTGHDHIIVRENTIYGNGWQGIGAHEVSDYRYEANDVYANGFASREETEGIMVWRSAGSIRSNVVYNNHGAGIRLWAQTPEEGSSAVILNNVLAGNEGGGLHISGAVQGGEVYQNTIAANTGPVLVVGDHVNGFEFMNNILHGQQPVQIEGEGNRFDFNLYAPGVSFAEQGDHALFGDPEFTASGDLNFHLRFSSPAVDTGAVLLSIIQDLEGTSRPQGGGYDIGAYEFVPQLQAFDDVPQDHWAYREVQALYGAGITAGCSQAPPLFCPENTMTRAESAVFLERGLHGAAYDPVEPFAVVFGDVALDAWYADWVDGLWRDGFTAGCSSDPLLYCPLDGHTRAEGSVFYLRMLEGPSFLPPEAGGLFADVALETWYAPWVEEAWRRGLLDPCSGEKSDPPEQLRMCPEERLTRARAAVMMARALGLVGE